MRASALYWTAVSTTDGLSGGPAAWLRCSGGGDGGGSHRGRGLPCRPSQSRRFHHRAATPGAIRRLNSASASTPSARPIGTAEGHGKQVSSSTLPMRRAHQAPLPAGAGGRQACRQQDFREVLYSRAASSRAGGSRLCSGHTCAQAGRHAAAADSTTHTQALCFDHAVPQPISIDCGSHGADARISHQEWLQTQKEKRDRKATPRQSQY